MILLAVHPVVANLLPEIILVGGASLILLLGVLQARSSAAWISLLSVLATLWFSRDLAETAAPAVASLHADSLVHFTRMATLVIGLLLLLVNQHVPEESEQPEFFALILFSLAGVLLVSIANDLILLFLALELVSVPTYILVGLSRRDMRAQEATGKYFFLGAFAAAMTLYGFSFLYGSAGTMQMMPAAGAEGSIASALLLPSVIEDKLTIVGFVLVLFGLAFKIAAVPLHFYVADVYQGAASPVTGLLGFVPKFAGFIAIIRVMSMAGWEHGEATFWLLWAMAALTMTVGNTLALMQQNVKRMLAYSSVAHSGYMLVALAAGPASLGSPSPLRNGLAAMLFYIVIYGAMNLGAFAALSYLRKRGADGEDDSAETIEEIAGAGRRHPWAALALAICVLSLMGFPPTGGFLGKLYVFSSAISAGAGTTHERAMIGLVVIGVLNSAVAAAYYLRIIASCYLGKPAEGVSASRCRALHAGLALCALVVMAVFAKPMALFDRAQSAVADVGAGVRDPRAHQIPAQVDRDKP